MPTPNSPEQTTNPATKIRVSGCQAKIVRRQKSETLLAEKAVEETFQEITTIRRQRKTREIMHRRTTVPPRKEKHLKKGPPMNKSRLRLLSALWIVRLLLLSCTNTAHYDSYQRIENPWQKDKEYYFTYEIEDITIPYDISLEIRNNNFYPYQNLWRY